MIRALPLLALLSSSCVAVLNRKTDVFVASSALRTEWQLGETRGLSGHCREVPNSSQPLTLTASRDGHEPLAVEIEPQGLPGWLIPFAVLDFALVVPGIIDLATGSLSSWPELVLIDLPPAGTRAAKLIETRR